MKIKDLLEYVDELQENVFSPKVKIRWINQLEAEVQTEILLMAAEGVVQYTVDDMETDLIAPPPHDQIYQEYLFWQIALAQGEAERANNASALFNRVLQEYKRFVAMTINPGNGNAELLRYYITAYQIAVKNGFTGTETEWLRSLIGKAGEPGAGLNIADQVASEAQLPDGTSLETGVGYLVGEGATALLYIWNGSEWFYKERLSIEGEKGDDGISPKVEVENIDGGHRVIITDASGSQQFDVMDGEDGEGSGSVEPGFSPTVNVTTITGGHRVTITDVNGSRYFDVMDGEDGEDGYSPTIKVSTISNGHRVTVTDKNGTTSFDVLNGKDGTGGGGGGTGGENGATFYPYVDENGNLSWTNDKGLTNPDTVNIKGEDGFSPAVAVSDITNGKQISITDKDGTKSFQILNGDDGVGIASVQQTTTATADGGDNVITVALTNGQKATFNVKNGHKGGDGVSIVSVEQTTTSSADGGSNVITVNLSNGQKTTFTVKNGSKGSSGRGVSSIVYDSSTNKWTVTYTDNTTATVDGPVIPDVSGYMPKSGGTFTGRVIASSQTASVSLLRNSKLVDADTDPTVNGEINWTYA